MNINTYLRRFGRYTLREKPFNEIDALILSELAYVNFQLVAPSIDESKAKPLRLKKLVVDDPLAFYRGSVDAIQNRTMVKLMMKSRRFKDLKIGFCENVFEKKTINQFFAMTIFLPTGEAFVAFRVTRRFLGGKRISISRSRKRSSLRWKPWNTSRGCPPFCRNVSIPEGIARGATWRCMPLCTCRKNCKNV